LAGRVEPAWPDAKTPAPDPIWRTLLSLVEIGHDLGPGRQLVPFAGASFACQVQPLLAIGGFPLGLGRTGDDLLGGEETFVAERLIGLGWTMAYRDRWRVRHQIAPDRLSPDWVARRAVKQGVSEAKMAIALGPRRRILAVAAKATAGLLLRGAAAKIWPAR